MSRGLALLIDILIRQVLVAAAGAGLALAGQLGMGIFLIVVFLGEWFYPVFFEVLGEGQTPGKKSMGLRVVNSDGTPIGWSASVIRNLLRFADFLPFFYVAGLVSMLCSTRFQRLGDLAAGTLVINLRDADPAASARAREVRGTRPARVPLDDREQRAILSFGERSAELSSQRVEELADLLAPLTGSRGARGSRELLRIANGIAGRE
ncbi:MAG: RDD family protein [Deltaproteobacteria bacterium]|nr:RDD family protein [Deltaproteobacteria bacterium]MBW2417966.1 RDD family protein [Deltaproteobacteria bacterium]